MTHEILSPPAKIMLVCGEPSGDQLGAQLIASLRKFAGESIQLTGVGGAAMADKGFDSLFPLDATAVMGLREVVPRIPAILRHVREAADFAVQTKPDAVVCIDSPDFTHRIARRIRKLDPAISLVNYVAPQVWASRPYRAKAMARYFDLVLALLPFEVDFFKSRGVNAVFVGHPVLERRQFIKGGAQLRERLSIGADVPVLALLPGSRSSEVKVLMPIFRQALVEIKRSVLDVVCLLPAVAHLDGVIRELASEWPTDLHILSGDEDKYASFDAANVALAASGTVTTELALANTPMAVVYKIGWLTLFLMRPFINVDHVSLVNILLGRPALAELLQERCNPEEIANAIVPLFQNQELRASMKRNLIQATDALGANAENPSDRAARALLDFVQERRGRKNQRLLSGT